MGLTVTWSFFPISHTEAEKKAFFSVAVVERLYSACLATKTATLRDSLSEITPQGPLFTKVSKHSSLILTFLFFQLPASVCIHHVS